MGKGEDKRTFPRSLIDMKVEIRTESHIFPAKIIDLTVEAISLEADKSFEIDQSVSVVFETSADLSKNQLQGEVTRCERLDSGAHMTVARVVDVNDEFLMDALALVHMSGPKQDRRSSTYNRDDDGR